jgi:CRP/FNR family cyclic AMP-dependent transcriptional regulator
VFGVIARNEQALAALARLCSQVPYAAGDTVLREGESGDRMFVLASGTVEVRKRTRHGDTYTVSEISADSGGLFGEVGLFDEEARTATVVCRTACEMYVVTRRQFQEFGEREPALALAVVNAVARALCRRLRRADEDIVTLFGALVDEVAESDGLQL